MRAIIAVPCIVALVLRAYTRKSLTIIGCLVAGLTASIHALHPSAIPFTLLGTFFLLGTSATKVKHDIKATLTQSSSGSSGGDGPRTSVQVVANSGCATLLILIHVWLYGLGNTTAPQCFGGGTTADILLMGIMANYAAVAADTFSSELGILSKSKPVLITSLRTVPPGTNGGVTLAGLLAGVGGSAAMAVTSLLLLKFCGAGQSGRIQTFLLLTALGTAGTLLDSLLGAVLQASVVDRRTGKVVEGLGGAKVLTKPRQPQHGAEDAGSKGHETRVINSGKDVLDNNQINLLMASIMTICGMVVGQLVLM
ncbi:pyruvate formate lyase activating enzyme [Exophiala viscosa]|uniref:Pyruvate formate lyase activating enzyme n=1 Tax=Exophiala viscosa TaxID=2486360 RepID=A0AAN6DYV8_9EURO|nr:pyruvate formate lyase activating enzyme [Exophiala viscosa]KAI1623953.1 pyruvate formate lyase activating enzyme [Exophiala viscosa]